MMFRVRVEEIAKASRGREIVIRVSNFLDERHPCLNVAEWPRLAREHVKYRLAIARRNCDL